jgi:hypothetical protein
VSGQTDIRGLLHGAADRYQSVRITVAHWLDQAAMFRGLERFRTNPHITEELEEIHARGDAGRIHEGAWRIWFTHPAFHREETYLDRGLEPVMTVSGGDGSVSWSWNPRTRRTSAWRDRSIAYLVPVGQMPPRDLPSPLATGPRVVAHWFHPIVGELLQPDELLEEGLSLEAPRRTEFVGREAWRVHATLSGWGQDRHPMWHENLPPADDYEFVVDAATGVLLRVADRFDGDEFSVREVLAVTFDEELDPQLFEPPTRPRGPWWRLWRFFR